MIAVENVSKSYPTRSGMVTVLKDINFTVRRGEKVGILGRNGAGKSTLIRMIGGAELPTTGNIRHSMTVSWPLAFGGAFQNARTGLDNLRCICRIYGVSIDDKVDFVRDFSELGKYFWEPIHTYSAGMRAKLAFALSMAVEFDCFLIDEVIAVGDMRFAEKCNHELFEKRGDRALVIASHVEFSIRQHCDTAAVLHEGRLHRFDNVDDAFAFYGEMEHQPRGADVAVS
jgi:capsular polysaccharide transport system ATP-binding protein